MRRCGRAACKADLSEMRPNAKWCSQKCAMRVRRGEKALQTRTGGPSGLQVSYRRAVMAMAVSLSTRHGVPVEEAQAEAEGYMRYILSDRQRARLDERDG